MLVADDHGIIVTTMDEWDHCNNMEHTHTVSGNFHTAVCCNDRPWVEIPTRYSNSRAPGRKVYVTGQLYIHSRDAMHGVCVG